MVSMREVQVGPHGFAHFDLELSEPEKRALQALKIRRTATYDNFGRVTALEAEAAGFIGSLGTAPDAAVHVARAVLAIAQEAIATFAAETAWATLRASLPTDAFDIPRWHVDGYFFRPQSANQRKVVVTLKGAPTLVCPLAGKWRQAFLECASRHQQDPLGLVGREELVKIVERGGGFETPGDMQATILVVGDRERAAIHSEPAIGSERLFLSVVPGSKEQVAALQERWRVHAERRSGD